MRTFADGTTIPVPGTEGASYPFFSPDGEWIGFTAGTFLKKAAIRGGAPIPICRAVVDYGASWGEDDTIVYAENAPGLLHVPASGGEPRRLTEERFSEPVFLPNGRGLLVEHQGGISAVSLETGEAKRMVERGGTPRYASSGHLVYEYERTLYALAFDPETLEVRGTPTPVMGAVRRIAIGPAQYDLANDGSLIYLPGVSTSTAERTLVWVARDGSFEPVTGTRRAFGSPRLSPDGSRIALTIAEGASIGDVWIHDLRRDALRRVTLGGSSSAPVWSPDGKAVTYSARQNDLRFLLRSDSQKEAGSPRSSSRMVSFISASSWSPDGKTLLYSTLVPERGWDQFLFFLEDSSSRSFVSSPDYDSEGQFSPDGNWIAYTSHESGKLQVYVQALAEPGRRWQISEQSGRDPVWTSGGKEIVYRSGKRILSVAVRTEPEFEASVPQVLFEGPFELETGYRNFDVSPDGRRFVTIQSDEGPLDRLVCVLNWFEELKRLVPIDR